MVHHAPYRRPLIRHLLVLDNNRALGNVDTVKELSDILVLDTALVGDGSSRLGNLLDVVALDDDLVLDVRESDGNTLEHWAVTNNLLTQEVTDLERTAALANDSVDGKVGVDKTHLVEEALGDTNDHVLDQRLDGPQASNVLAATVVDGEGDLGAGLGLDLELVVGIDFGVKWCG